MDIAITALAGRLSLSILSSPTIESIGTAKKIITMMIGDSTRTSCTFGAWGNPQIEQLGVIPGTCLATV